jgi:hypothetical protein
MTEREDARDEWFSEKYAEQLKHEDDDLLIEMLEDRGYKVSKDPTLQERILDREILLRAYQGAVNATKEELKRLKKEEKDDRRKKQNN